MFHVSEHKGASTTRITWAALLNTPPVAEVMISSRLLPCSSESVEMAALSFVTSGQSREHAHGTEKRKYT